ncbi:PAQR family membrane homeostasis protein TrhA [Desulfosediminicola flagellatus]|uniref:PAQR family membrane homeostasis protein TrhA n=1 Tax=Desulfosediminicola flagellatus TaxID=2569541 RepID=UPI0010ABC469|nr:hemolysin III family protein [Desulfosediminicola flagellatus]
MHVPYPIPGFSDPFSSLSHLVGAFIFLVLSIPLLRSGKGNLLRLFALSVFSFASVFMLSMSGVYHLLSPEGEARTVLQRLDHSAIFVLIVGTMTPIHLILFRGFMRWGWLIMVWVIAITSIVLKNIFFTSFPDWLGLVLFLSLGWGGAVTAGILWYQRSLKFISMLIWGGLAYTAGAVLEFIQQPVIIPGVLGPHELFHVAVLVGLSLHWKYIYGIVPLHHVLKER